MNFIIGKNEDDEFKKLTPHWIRMTRFLELEDGLRSRHGKYPWLWCLLTVHQEFDSRLAIATSLKPLTDQFELYPLKTIQRVALFRQDVKTQDLTHAFLAFLASRQESYRLCWYFIQRSLQAQFKSLEEPTEIHSSGVGMTMKPDTVSGARISTTRLHLQVKTKLWPNKSGISPSNFRRTMPTSEIAR
ncbi:hypothetical protein V2G26_020525 [Clonostachys chloroleuca]